MKMLITLVLLNLIAYPALHAQIYAKTINRDTQIQGAFEDLGVNDKYVFYSESPFAAIIGNYKEFTVLRGDLSNGNFKRFELNAGHEIHDIIGSKVLKDKLVLYYSSSLDEKSGPYEIYASEFDLEMNIKNSKLLTESKSDKYQFYLSTNKGGFQKPQMLTNSG